MTSDKQIAANQRNSQLSTGPRTTAGRKASSMNALRHGLTGQIDVMTPEEREVYDQFCSSFAASLNPETVVEHQFAHAVAAETWRLNRARSIENNIFAIASANMEDDNDLYDPDREAECPDPIAPALAAAQVFIADPHRFQLLTLYEQRIHRTMQKNLKQLVELQTARRAAESSQKARRDQALDEARLLTRLAEIKGVPYGQALSPECAGNETHVWSAEPNGFVFSNAEIAASIRRESLLTEARQLLRPANKHSGPITTTLAA